MLTIAQRREILKYFDQNLTVTKVSKLTGLPKTSLCHIKKNREKILRDFEIVQGNMLKSNIKRVKPASHVDVDRACYLWYLQQRTLEPLLASRAGLKKQSRVFHSSLCRKAYCNFGSSDGWVSKFYRRHQISCGTSNEEILVPFAAKLVAKLEERGLTMDQLYLGIESRLLWGATPAIDVDGERISFFVCSNASGTNRAALQVIGTEEISFESPTNASYCTTPNGYQTQSSFKKYFNQVLIPEISSFNSDAGLQNGGILILECTTSYNYYDSFENDIGLEVLFLPANISIEQVVKLGESPFLLPLKIAYREKLLLAKPSNKELHLSTAIQWLAQSWMDMDSSVIIKSWKTLLFAFGPFVEQNFIDDPIEITPELSMDQLIKLKENLGQWVTAEQLQLWLTTVDGPLAPVLSDAEIISLGEHQTPPREESNEIEMIDSEMTIELEQPSLESVKQEPMESYETVYIKSEFPALSEEEVPAYNEEDSKDQKDPMLQQVEARK